MEIKSLYHLNEHFNQSMAWRRKELATLKLLVSSARGDDTKNTILRGALALLYAHWEGFVKDAATAYLEYVARQPHRYEEMTTNFVALAMKAKLADAQQTNVASKFIEVAEFFLTGLAEPFQVSWDKAIDTESNLKAKVFQGIIDKLGLDYKKYATKENLIDETLLGNRNKIAHGRYLLIDSKEYEALHREVIELMALFQQQIMDAARERRYLRSVSR